MRNLFNIIILLTLFNCANPPNVEPPTPNIEYLTPINIYENSIQKVALITPILQNSIGTGVVIDSTGLLLTNWHIVGKDRLVWVAFHKPNALNKEDYEPMDWRIAEVIKTDTLRDLALLKIDSLNINPLNLGTANDLRVGQEIYSISHPQGQLFSFAKGLISRLPNQMVIAYPGIEKTGSTSILTRAAILFGLRDTTNHTNNNHKIVANMIQMQFPENKGSSGGPILDTQGRLIGINSAAHRDGESLSFAIRIDEIIDFLKSEQSQDISE